jgi:hypothetical protein
MKIIPLIKNNMCNANIMLSNVCKKEKYLCEIREHQFTYDMKFILEAINKYITFKDKWLQFNFKIINFQWENEFSSYFPPKKNNFVSLKIFFFMISLKKKTLQGKWKNYIHTCCEGRKLVNYLNENIAIFVSWRMFCCIK